MKPFIKSFFDSKLLYMIIIHSKTFVAIDLIGILIDDWGKRLDKELDVSIKILNDVREFEKNNNLNK